MASPLQEPSKVFPPHSYTLLCTPTQQASLAYGCRATYVGIGRVAANERSHVVGVGAALGVGGINPEGGLLLKLGGDAAAQEIVQVNGCPLKVAVAQVTCTSRLGCPCKWKCSQGVDLGWALGGREER